MIQILDLVLVVAITALVQKGLGIRMKSPQAALAVAGAGIAEVVLARAFPLAMGPATTLLLLVLVLNPILEEGVRVRFSDDAKAGTVRGWQFLSTSLMLGTLEAIVKVFALASQFPPSDLLTALHAYILQVAALSIAFHLNMGLLLLRTLDAKLDAPFLIMWGIHAVYNLLFLLTEPSQMAGKNMQLAAFLLGNLALMAFLLKRVPRSV